MLESLENVALRTLRDFPRTVSKNGRRLTNTVQYTYTSISSLKSHQALEHFEYPLLAMFFFFKWGLIFYASIGIEPTLTCIFTNWPLWGWLSIKKAIMVALYEFVLKYSLAMAKIDVPAKCLFFLIHFYLRS